MEKIFNFFRFINYNVFETNNTLVLNVINVDGCLVKLQTFGNSTGAEVISSVVELLETSDKCYEGYEIIHVCSGHTIDYNTSMTVAGVEDNDEIYLLKKHIRSNKNSELKRAPTQAMINEVTGYIGNTPGKSFKLKRDFVRLVIGDHLYIRNFLVEMAVESAYIISTGPNADFLIRYFKQKILRRRKFREDAVKTLTELGFEKSRCLYAIKLKKNIYSEALNWLIDHSEDPATYSSYNNSASFISTISSDIQGKFQRLNEIIRIYGRTGQQHCEKLLKTFSEMGFNADDSMNALSSSDWDPTRAIGVLCEEQESTKCFNPVIKNVLQSSSAQSYLSDPEIFMTIIYLLGSQSGSAGIDYNWESTKLKYQHVASILSKCNDEKGYLARQNIDLK